MRPTLWQAVLPFCCSIGFFAGAYTQIRSSRKAGGMSSRVRLSVRLALAGGIISLLGAIVFAFAALYPLGHQ